jgi:hypothetical protein
MSETNARDVARASKEIDWQKKMREMVKQEKEREINRKLTAIVKGPHQDTTRVCLNAIQHGAPLFHSFLPIPGNFTSITDSRYPTPI